MVTREGVGLVRMDVAPCRWSAAAPGVSVCARLPGSGPRPGLGRRWAWAGGRLPGAEPEAVVPRLAGVIRPHPAPEEESGGLSPRPPRPAGSGSGMKRVSGGLLLLEPFRAEG